MVKYLSPQCIQLSIKGLKKKVHPFFGITFLTCKRADFPVGKGEDIALDQATKRYMDEFFKVHPQSDFYFQPFRSNSKDKNWVRDDYPSSGLQAVNTQSFSRAFLHTKKEKTWGWIKDYVEVLADKLGYSDKYKLSAIDLAVWVFKDKKWQSDTTLENIRDYFFNYFHITEEEKSSLFTDVIPKEYDALKPQFQGRCIDWNDYRLFISTPSDVPQERGAVLTSLLLKNVGPASSISLEPSRRLNIITGDNGLGKTFLIECVCWAMTDLWSENPAYPQDSQRKSTISYSLSTREYAPSYNEAEYKASRAKWIRNKDKVMPVPGLMVYARVDGSYTLWDPNTPAHSSTNQSNLFTYSNILEGIPKIIGGLLSDLVKWKMDPQKYPYKVLCDVLKALSPPDMGELQLGTPVRLPEDSREFPTIIHPYGEVPIIYTSAGVKRIVTLAYLIVWAWYEHRTNANLYNKPIDKRMIILIDEVEAHLHPKWQRTILPALLQVHKFLSQEIEVQFLVSTHSPLVLASIETTFDVKQDKLFHLRMNDKTFEAELDEIEFERRSQVSSWLVSPIFELKHARSKEAETAIENAKSLQLQDTADVSKVAEVHKELLGCLAETDPFWTRWIFFAEKHGVKI